MDFSLTEEDAGILRHLASVEPREARAYLQDRPEIARRMAAWPPEIRLEVCRILYRSFDAARREAHRASRAGASSLLATLDDDAG